MSDITQMKETGPNSPRMAAGQDWSHGFCLVTGKRTWYLAAETGVLMRTWMSVIRNVQWSDAAGDDSL